MTGTPEQQFTCFLRTITYPTAATDYTSAFTPTEWRMLDRAKGNT